MSITQLDSLVPSSLTGNMSINDILEAMYVTSNNGNQILDFCAKINKVLNLTNNITANNYAAFYVNWNTTTNNIRSIIGRTQMLQFIRLLHNPNASSQKFSQLVNLLQAFDTYNRKSGHMIQRFKPSCCYGVPNRINGIRNGWHISIDSFSNVFHRYRSITF